LSLVYLLAHCLVFEIKIISVIEVMWLKVAFDLNTPDKPSALSFHNGSAL